MLLATWLFSSLALVVQHDVPAALQAREKYPTKLVLPGYPWAAKLAMAQGSFCVAVEIGSDGEVSRASILHQDVGHPAGDASVFTSDLLRAIRQWRYPPAALERKTLLRVRYVFSLDPEKTGALFDAPETLELRGAVDPVDHPDHIIWKPGTGPRSPDLKRDPCAPPSTEKR